MLVYIMEVTYLYLGLYNQFDFVHILVMLLNIECLDSYAAFDLY